MDNQKIRVIVLSCILLLGIAYTIYQYYGLNDEFEITDTEALNAAKWLKMSDESKYDDCKKVAATNIDKWFDLFKKNRNSLGKKIYRRLRSKNHDKDGVYKITFNSSFDNARKINEMVWIDKKGKVWQAKYSYMRRPYPTWKSKDNGTPREYSEVKTTISRALRAMQDLDVDFFDQVMLRCEKFRFGKRVVKSLKKQFKKTGKPYKTQIANRFRFTRSFPGKTEINGVLATANCYYKIKKKVYRQTIVFILYKDNSTAKPRWEVHRFSPRKVVAQKKRKAAKKKAKKITIKKVKNVEK